MYSPIIPIAISCKPPNSNIRHTIVGKPLTGSPYNIVRIIIKAI